VNSLSKAFVEQKNSNTKYPSRIIVRTPQGEKTPKMLEVEKRIGRTLEIDFQENYLSTQTQGELSQ
jgi:hypothetical protein